MGNEIKNAVIESATITNDDHGLLSAWLFVNYGGSGQGFGGYALYLPKSFRHHKLEGPNFAGHFIWRVLEIAGVSEWSNYQDEAKLLSAIICASLPGFVGCCIWLTLNTQFWGPPAIGVSILWMWFLSEKAWKGLRRKS